MARHYNHPTEPAETDTEAQAYVNGWYHCDAGNDIRFGNPYTKPALRSAWNEGAIDCMESPEPDDYPMPEAMGFHDD